MDELITVIINAYNVEKYIKKCLDSIVNQTYKNLEIIIVNDGSTDKTLEICKSYKDKRIRIINTENQGLALSRNTGLDNAKGEYYYFVDADDFVELDVIEYLYKLIKKYDRRIAMCENLKIYDYNFKKQEVEEEITIKDDKEMIARIMYDIGMSGTTWNKLYHKSIFATRRFENRIVNDIVVTYKCYIDAGEVIFSNQCKYYYLKHPDSILGRSVRERQIDMYKASLERYYYIKNIYPDLIDNDIGMLLMIFHRYRVDYAKMADFIKSAKMKKKYNEIFSLKKVLKCRVSRRMKVKLILFRINPKIYTIGKKVYHILKKNKKNITKK
jgi:glycosyltransferase involved in cell wall biosynthesis